MIAPILSGKGTSKSGASPSAIAANSVSSLPRQRLDLSRGGQMIAPIFSGKGTSKSGAFSICDRRELSPFTASAAAGPEPRGADDRPNSLKKRDEQERSFSQRKRHSIKIISIPGLKTHSIPSRTERACSPPNA